MAKIYCVYRKCSEDYSSDVLVAVTTNFDTVSEVIGKDIFSYYFYEYDDASELLPMFQIMLDAEFNCCYSMQSVNYLMREDVQRVSKGYYCFVRAKSLTEAIEKAVEMAKDTFRRVTK